MWVCLKKGNSRICGDLGGKTYDTLYDIWRLKLLRPSHMTGKSASKPVFASVIFIESSSGQHGSTWVKPALRPLRKSMVYSMGAPKQSSKRRWQEQHIRDASLASGCTDDGWKQGLAPAVTWIDVFFPFRKDRRCGWTMKHGSWTWAESGTGISWLRWAMDELPYILVPGGLTRTWLYANQLDGQFNKT